MKILLKTRSELNNKYDIFDTQAAILYSKLYQKQKYIHKNNFKKILLIIDYWFLIYDNLIFNKSNKVNYFLELIKKNKNININIIDLFDKSFKQKEFENKSNISFFKYCISIPFIFIFHKFNPIILLGGEGKYFRIFEILSYYWYNYYKNYKINYDKTKKDHFIKEICKIKKYNNSEIQLLKLILPNIFFFEKNSIIFKKKYTFYCSPNIFFENYKFIKFLLSKKEIIIHGTMHGYGYGQLKKNLIESYELSISKNYDYWFPFNSYHIGRYRKIKSSVNISRKKTNILWVGRNDLNDYEKFIRRDQIIHYQDIQILNKMDNALSKYENCIYVKAPKHSTKSWLPTKTKNISLNKKIEYYINPSNDILLFDNLTSSLIFYAIKLNIKFLIFMSTNNLECFTSKYQIFINDLINKNILFNDIKEFEKRINYLLINKKIKKYYILNNKLLEHMDQEIQHYYREI